MTEYQFYDSLPAAPEWDDLQLDTDPEQEGIEAKKDALRDSFKSFQDGPAHILQRNMMTGQATPVMLRDAVCRLSNMILIAGETGDFHTEAEIVNSLNTLCLIASQTLYH